MGVRSILAIDELEESCSCHLPRQSPVHCAHCNLRTSSLSTNSLRRPGIPYPRGVSQSGQKGYPLGSEEKGTGGERGRGGIGFVPLPLPPARVQMLHHPRAFVLLRAAARAISKVQGAHKVSSGQQGQRRKRYRFSSEESRVSPATHFCSAHHSSERLPRQGK